jgi:hypothetical protein
MGSGHKSQARVAIRTIRFAIDWTLGIRPGLLRKHDDFEHPPTGPIQPLNSTDHRAITLLADFRHAQG